MGKLLATWYIKIYESFFGTTNIYRTIKRFDNYFTEIVDAEPFSTLYQVVLTLGVTVILILFFIDLGDRMTTKEISPEQIFRSLLLVFVTYEILTNALEIVKLLVQSGEELAFQIATGSGTAQNFFANQNNVTYLVNGFNKSGIEDEIGYILKAIIPFLICFVSDMIVSFIAVVRLIELIVFAAFAPIAVADMYKEGSKSGGVKYFKKIFAKTLQFSVIILICLVCGQIINQMTLSNTVSVIDASTILKHYTNASGNILYFTADSVKLFVNSLLAKGKYLTMVAILCTKVGLILKSSSICNEIAGV